MLPPLTAPPSPPAPPAPPSPASPTDPSSPAAGAPRSACPTVVARVDGAATDRTTVAASAASAAVTAVTGRHAAVTALPARASRYAIIAGKCRVGAIPAGTALSAIADRSGATAVTAGAAVDPDAAIAAVTEKSRGPAGTALAPLRRWHRRRHLRTTNHRHHRWPRPRCHHQCRWRRYRSGIRRNLY